MRSNYRETSRKKARYSQHGNHANHAYGLLMVVFHMAGSNSQLRSGETASVPGMLGTAALAGAVTKET